MKAPGSPSSPDVAGARSVLFVCLGNICRSPLARAVFEHLAHARGVRDQLFIDSCGTGSWHVGNPADPRAITLARERKIPLIHAARQFDSDSDPARFDIILAMDNANVHALHRAGAPADKTHLFLAFADPARADPRDAEALRSREVPDPYYGRREDFEQVYRLVFLASEDLLDRIFPDSPQR